MSDWTKKDALIAKHKSKSGLRGRVDANCISCIYDPEGTGNWRQQVSACTVVLCPIHDVRARSVPKKRTANMASQINPNGDV